MPGMMDTILDLGLNDATTAGLARATGDEAFAADCRQRFEATFRSIVGVADVPDDPWQQLRLAIEAVFRSWQSDRAVAYRAKEGIADDLGTAVTVQAMVFGNRGADSATGVLFTRDPASGEDRLYGDILFDAQGEDVVAGTHATEPIAVLDERLPAVAAELRTAADRLERHYADLCDIEFTIEQGRLWMLQTRVGKRSPAAALRIAVEMAEEQGFPLTRDEAVGAGRAAARGPAAVRDDPKPSRAPDRDRAAGLARDGERADRHRSDGGGQRPPRPVRAPSSCAPRPRRTTSTGWPSPRASSRRAAVWRVTRRSWPAAGASRQSSARPAWRSVTGTIWVGDRTFRAGDVITIDGRSGEVFEGAIPSTDEVVPEALVLLDWARELGIAIGGRCCSRRPSLVGGIAADPPSRT